MCGICGMVGATAEQSRVEQMCGALSHRGPDYQGVWADPAGAVLGHRRLSIIDLSAAGNQPMHNEDGTLHLVFNGEIYNFHELRAELERKGHQFRSRSDSEVILHLYEEHGDDLVHRLDGMFALALWDQKHRRLLLARDRLGKKPVYYTTAGPSLLFASELKALLRGLDRKPPINPRAVADYLQYLYVPAPHTILEGVMKLPPAHRLVWTAATGPVVQRYWDIKVDDRFRGIHEEEAVRLVSAGLEAAVTKRLISDVPLGAFLSGGIDSGAIVALMREASQGPVRTFTIGYGGSAPRYEESAEAAELAAALGTEHSLIQAANNLFEVLPKVAYHFDEPYGNATALLTYLLTMRCRDQVTVALVGDGGDEIFAGYPRHLAMQLAQNYRLVPEPLRRMAAGMVNWLPESFSGDHSARRVKGFVQAGALPEVEMYARWVGYYGPEEQRDLLTPAYQKAIAGHDPLWLMRQQFAAAEANGATDVGNAACYVDLTTFLPFNLLEAADKMSMAHAFELRAPFADHGLVELAMNLPFALRLKGRRSKYVLRKAMESRLPGAALSRPKRGFNPPVGIWLEAGGQPLLEKYLSKRALEQTGVLEPSAVAALLDEHRLRRRDLSTHLWGLIMLQEWLFQYHDLAG